MLDGIRVLDLGAFITAPLAGMMLADLGADVVKVEPPGGEPFRHAGGQNPTYGDTFVAYNRNKRGLVLDLRDGKDRATMHRLLACADVLIENFRPGVLEKLGLDPAELRRKYPRLIHCSITGFGKKGPYRDRPAFDTVGQSMSGLLSLFVDPARPDCLGPSTTDTVTGMYACYGVLGALVERARTGTGRRIEVNMIEASMAFVQDAFTNYTRGGEVGDRYSRVTRSQSYAFRCADGALLGIQLSGQEKFWTGLIDALEAPELAADPRFNGRLIRIENYHPLERELAARFLKRPRAEWLARLAATDVPFAPINNVKEALADPQMLALGSAVATHHPREGEVLSVACPLLVDGARPQARGAAPPQIGEHAAEILAEWGAGAD